MPLLLRNLGFCTLTVVTLLSLVTWGNAGECCRHCGCETCVRKVCHVVEEIKKVPVTKYTYACEDFCVPGPSKREGCTCEVDCKGCERCKPNYVPQCAKVYTRTKLVKTTVEEDKKVYRWIVETVCEQCASHLHSQPPAGGGTTVAVSPAAIPLPPPPVPVVVEGEFEPRKLPVRVSDQRGTAKAKNAANLAK